MKNELTSGNINGGNEIAISILLKEINNCYENENNDVRITCRDNSRRKTYCKQKKKQIVKKKNEICIYRLIEFRYRFQKPFRRPIRHRSTAIYAKSDTNDVMFGINKQNKQKITSLHERLKKIIKIWIFFFKKNNKNN